eukprot:2847087-Ditylum_brightwellii.AAC.1
MLQQGTNISVIQDKICDKVCQLPTGMVIKTALSTTESEYIAMSQAMMEVIPLINLLNDINESIRISQDSSMEFKCTVLEDNNGYIALAKCPRMRPRTKRISINYHHFRKKVEEGLI